MAQCEVCGNDCDTTFQVITQDVTYGFGSFECAIHRLPPRREVG